MSPHRCDETCLCAVHGTDLIYSPAFDDHACQDSSCKYGHGGAPMTDPESVAAFLARHRADQAAVEASNCFAADTCTLDMNCPFIVSCVASLNSAAP